MYDELLKRYDEVSRFKKEQWTEMEHGAYFSWSEFEMVDQMAIAIRNLKQEASNGPEQVFNDFASKQKPLGPEFDKAIFSNIEELYEP